MIDNSWYEEVRNRFHCDHEDIQPTKQTNAAGVLVVVLQCKRCGKYMRQAKKSEYDTDRLPWFDKALQEEWSREMSQAYQQARQKAIVTEDLIWWDDYSRYLNSAEWNSLRARVLLRDNYLCQGCLVNRATQVHHTSYRMYNATGHSMAFELVSVCDDCHQAMHPHMQGN